MYKFKIVPGSVVRYGERVTGFRVKQRFLRFFWLSCRERLYGDLMVPPYRPFFESYADAVSYAKRKIAAAVKA